MVGLTGEFLDVWQGKDLGDWELLEGAKVPQTRSGCKERI